MELEKGKLYVQFEGGQIEPFSDGLIEDIAFSAGISYEEAEYDFKRLYMNEPVSFEIKCKPLKGKARREMEELFKAKEPKLVKGLFPIKFFLPNERVKEKYDREIVLLDFLNNFPEYKEMIDLPWFVEHMKKEISKYNI